MKITAVLGTSALMFGVAGPAHAQDPPPAFEGAWQGTVSVVGTDQRGADDDATRFANDFRIRMVIAGQAATVYLEGDLWLRLGEPGQFRLEGGIDTTIVYGALSFGQRVETWVFHLTRDRTSPELRIALSRNTASTAPGAGQGSASTMGALGTLTRVEDPDRDW